MARFTLDKLFTRWAPASVQPIRHGWYRTRTEKLTHSWWNEMAYWDGQGWWRFGTQMGASLKVRTPLKVLQWQGLCMPLQEAIALVRANLPKTLQARRGYCHFLAVVLQHNDIHPVLREQAA